MNINKSTQYLIGAIFFLIIGIANLIIYDFKGLGLIMFICCLTFFIHNVTNYRKSK